MSSPNEIREALRSARRDLPELEKALNGALVRDPLRGELHLARGILLLYRDQDFEAARVAFARAREHTGTDGTLSPERAEAWLEEAHALELLGRDAEARAAAQSAFDASPAGPARAKAAFHLARLEAVRGDLDAALVAHREARSHYESGEGPGLAEYHGFEAWLAERRRDPRAWVRAVRDLTGVDASALAFRRVARRKTPRRRVRRLLRLLRRLEKALDMAEQGGWADRLARTDLDWTLALEGLLLHLLGRPQRALRKLRRAIARNPRNALAYHVAGKCLLSRQRPTAATRRLERAAELSPHPDVLLDLSRAQERAGDLERARATLERLVELAPTPSVLARLARTAEALDRKEEALTAYLRASAHDLQRERAFAARIGLLLTDLGRDDDARRWLDRALHVNGGDPELLLARGRVLARLGRARRAYRDVSRAADALEAVRSQGNNENEDLLTQAHFQKGELLARLGRPAEAMGELDRCLDRAPDRDDALLLKGDCARALGRHREAVDLWKEVIDRKLGEKLLQHGVALYDEGKDIEALRKYRAAFERFPKGWEVFYRTAQAYARLGESAPALKYLAIALKINRNVRMLLEKDPAVARLRGTPEFRELLAVPHARDAAPDGSSSPPK